MNQATLELDVRPHRINWYERTKSFKHRVSVQIETDDYIIKTAENARELIKALELRHEIFIEEWQGLKSDSGLDVDEYDFMGDHLLIISKKDNEVIGAYRLLCSRFTESFYSEHEFEMACFLKWPGVKLELGRACIRADHRTGTAIDLLWKGLAAYIKVSRARFLFGCASVRETNPESVARLMRYIESQGGWNLEHQVWPTREYRMLGFSLAMAEPLLPSEAKKMLPALLRTYLHAGAHVFGYPALDREFQCVDLFTVLDVQGMNARFSERYFAGQGELR